jgi:GH15 family glucan-1,4-alpha-glucosidase
VPAHIEDYALGGTVEAIEKHLMSDGLVLRYRTEHTDDGLPPGEGVFLACSFWMVSALKMIGRIDDANSYSSASCRCAMRLACPRRNTIRNPDS